MSSRIRGLTAIPQALTVLRGVFLSLVLGGMVDCGMARGSGEEEQAAHAPVRLGSRSIHRVLDGVGRMGGVRFCFEISEDRSGWLYDARKWKVPDGSSLEDILKEIQADGFDLVRREKVILVVDRSLKDLKHNPMDSRVLDLQYEGTTSKLDFALSDKAAGFMPTTLEAVGGRPEDVEFRVEGDASVREVLLQVTSRFGNRWTARIRDIPADAKVPVRDLEGNVLALIGDFNLYFTIDP